jgi:hypothetical protein
MLLYYRMLSRMRKIAARPETFAPLDIEKKVCIREDVIVEKSSVEVQ